MESLVSCFGYRSVQVSYKPGNNCRAGIFIVLKDLEIYFPALTQRIKLLKCYRQRSTGVLQQADLVPTGKRMAAYFMQQAVPRSSQGHTHTHTHSQTLPCYYWNNVLLTARILQAYLLQAEQAKGVRVSKLHNVHHSVF